LTATSWRSLRASILKQVSDLEVDDGGVLLLVGWWYYLEGRPVPQNVLLHIERTSDTEFRFALINTAPDGGLQYHPRRAFLTPPKIKYETVLVFERLPASRLLDDAWWLTVVTICRLQEPAGRGRVLRPPHSVPAQRADRALPRQAAPRRQRRVPHAAGGRHRLLPRAARGGRHVLRRVCGLTSAQYKWLTLAVRMRFVRAIEADLGAVLSVSDADRRLVTLASRQLAYTAAKLCTHYEAKQTAAAAAAAAAAVNKENSAPQHGGATADEPLLSEASLAEVLRSSLKLASDVDSLLARKPCDDDDSSLPPPPLDLDSGAMRELQYEPELFPLFDHVAVQASTAGLEGPAKGFPEHRPINLLKVTDAVRTFEEAVAGMRHVDRVCWFLTNQTSVQRGAFLRTSLIVSLFCHVLPMPLGEKSRAKPGQRCLWAEAQIEYAHQVEFSLLMRRLAQHFVGGVLSLQHTRRFNATKIIVLGAMNAMLDAVLRKDTRGPEGKAFASPVMLHLAGISDADLAKTGESTETRAKHSVGAALFKVQCETLEIVHQELNVARAGILDYFGELEVPESRELFAWERDRYQMPPRAADLAFVERIGHELCAKTDPTAITGEAPTVVTVWVEYEVLRDVSFLWKWLMCPDNRVFPDVLTTLNGHSPHIMRPKWQMQNGKIKVMCAEIDLLERFTRFSSSSIRSPRSATRRARCPPSTRRRRWCSPRTTCCTRAICPSLAAR
jgi:hypothetical protein